MRYAARRMLLAESARTLITEQDATIALGFDPGPGTLVEPSGIDRRYAHARSDLT